MSQVQTPPPMEPFTPAQQVFVNELVLSLACLASVVETFEAFSDLPETLRWPMQTPLVIRSRAMVSLAHHALQLLERPDPGRVVSRWIDRFCAQKTTECRAQVQEGDGGLGAQALLEAMGFEVCDEPAGGAVAGGFFVKGLRPGGFVEQFFEGRQP